MEYQKIINLLENALNQPSKFKIINWVEINDVSNGVCNTGSPVKLRTLMLRSSLCDYSDAYILVKGAVSNTGTTTAPNNRNKKVIFLELYSVYWLHKWNKQ